MCTCVHVSVAEQSNLFVRVLGGVWSSIKPQAPLVILVLCHPASGGYTRFAGSSLIYLILHYPPLILSRSPITSTYT